MLDRLRHGIYVAGKHPLPSTIAFAAENAIFTWLTSSYGTYDVLSPASVGHDLEEGLSLSILLTGLAKAREQAASGHPIRALATSQASVLASSLIALPEGKGGQGVAKNIVYGEVLTTFQLWNAASTNTRRYASRPNTN